MWDSNQSPQLQRLARIIKFCMEQRRWSDCADVQAGLRLCCLQTTKDRASHVAAYMSTYTYSCMFSLTTWKSRPARFSVLLSVPKEPGGTRMLVARTREGSVQKSSWNLNELLLIVMCAYRKIIGKMWFYDFVCFDSLRPSQQVLVISGRIFLGWTRTKQ